MTTLENATTIPTTFLDSCAGARNSSTYTVDKTALIERILNDRGTRTFLFCRPRRFGNSLNLSMIDAFLSLNHRGTTGSMAPASQRTKSSAA